MGILLSGRGLAALFTAAQVSLAPVAFAGISQPAPAPASTASTNEVAMFKELRDTAAIERCLAAVVRAELDLVLMKRNAAVGPVNCQTYLLRENGQDELVLSLTPSAAGDDASQQNIVIRFVRNGTGGYDVRSTINYASTSGDEKEEADYSFVQNYSLTPQQGGFGIQNIVTGGSPSEDSDDRTPVSLAQIRAEFNAAEVREMDAALAVLSAANRSVARAFPQIESAYSHPLTAAEFKKVSTHFEQDKIMDCAETGAGENEVRNGQTYALYTGGGYVCALNRTAGVNGSAKWSFAAALNAVSLNAPQAINIDIDAVLSPKVLTTPYDFDKGFSNNVTGKIVVPLGDGKSFLRVQQVAAVSYNTTYDEKPASISVTPQFFIDGTRDGKNSRPVKVEDLSAPEREILDVAHKQLTENMDVVVKEMTPGMVVAQEAKSLFTEKNVGACLDAQAKAKPEKDASGQIRQSGSAAGLSCSTVYALKTKDEERMTLTVGPAANSDADHMEVELLMVRQFNEAGKVGKGYTNLFRIGAYWPTTDIVGLAGVGQACSRAYDKYVYASPSSAAAHAGEPDAYFGAAANVCPIGNRGEPLKAEAHKSPVNIMTVNGVDEATAALSVIVAVRDAVVQKFGKKITLAPAVK